MWGSNLVDVIELTQTKWLLCYGLWAHQQEELHRLKLLHCGSDLKNSIVRSVCQDSRRDEVTMVTTCRKYLAFQNQGFLRSVLASSSWSAMSRVIHKVQPNTSELHKPARVFASGHIESNPPNTFKKTVLKQLKFFLEEMYWLFHPQLSFSTTTVRNFQVFWLKTYCSNRALVDCWGFWLLLLNSGK